ncbi:MAG: competence/damage-inducible protein A, partial [Bacillota bacterium]
MAQAVRAELVMIGTELLLGQTVDTNAAHIAEKLAENGIHVYFKATVGDNWTRMTAVLAQALTRADIVITSGGLGPTEDDLTPEVVASVLCLPLVGDRRGLGGQ